MSMNAKTLLFWIEKIAQKEQNGQNADFEIRSAKLWAEITFN